MKKSQYTIRQVPERLDGMLRRLAVREGKSLNGTLLEALKKGVGLKSEPVRYDDLDDLSGTWVDDPEFDRVVEAMDTVDEDLWK